MWLYIPLMGTDLKLGKGHNCRSQMGDIPLLCLMRRSLQQPLAERLSRPETRRKLAAACCNTYINIAAQNDRKVFPEGYGLYLIRISRFPTSLSMWVAVYMISNWPPYFFRWNTPSHPSLVTYLLYVSVRTWCWSPSTLGIYRRQFRSQTSDNMDRWKAEQGRGREKRKIRRKKNRRERVRRKKMEMREKVGKSPNTVFFQWFGAPEGRKVGSLKRRVRSQLARWEMKNCTPLWREAHLQVKMYKTPQLRTTFGSCDVEKVHAVVARSTFPSQNVQNTSAPDHFWKLRCRKSARRCGTKHISKSKCTKHTIVGPLLEVAMSKKCTPLWREAHFQVKMYKTPHVRATFGGSDVEKVHVVVARSTFRSQMYKTPHVCATFGGSDVASLHYTTLHYITLHYTPLHYAPLHYTLHYITQHYNYNNTTTLHYTPLH